jgi:proline iminopeptidase
MKNIYYLLLIMPMLLYSQTEQIITSGNSKLYFRTFGEGKPLLIINGGPGFNSDGFANLAESLSRFKYQTIIYDQRGTGKSILDKINEETITMDLMVQDMENLRKYLKINQWTILGHSFGGILAAYYASKYPESVDRLIFSSSGGINMNFISYVSQKQQDILTPIQRDSLSYFQKKHNNGDTSIETRKGRTKYLAFSYVYDKTKAAVIAERLMQINPEINSLVIQDLLKIAYDCSKTFTEFIKPVLVLQGTNDIITLETAKEIVKAFPISKLVVMKKCGHYGWLDRPDLYFECIKTFLNS